MKIVTTAAEPPQPLKLHSATAADGDRLEFFPVKLRQDFALSPDLPLDPQGRGPGLPAAAVDAPVRPSRLIAQVIAGMRQFVKKGFFEQGRLQSKLQPDAHSMARPGHIAAQGARRVTAPDRQGGDSGQQGCRLMVAEHPPRRRADPGPDLQPLGQGMYGMFRFDGPDS